MTSLHQAIAPNPLIMTPQALVVDAIATMSTARATCWLAEPATEGNSIHLTDSQASCILVVEAGHLVGIFTERDVVRLSGIGPISPEQQLSEVMVSPVVVLRQSAFTDIFVALNLFQQYHIRHLPILDDQGQVIGLVTHESLRQLLRPVDLLRLQMISEVMTGQVIQAAPTTSVRDIARQMATQRVSSIILVEVEARSLPPHSSPSALAQASPLVRPIGIVTERDIVQFQALELDFETIQAHQVMSSPVFTVTPEDSLWTVQQLMQRHHVGRLVVTDAQGALRGIVTQTSLLKALNPLELYKLVDSLEQKVCQLEAEKVELLQNQNAGLERQIQERTQALQAQAERERLLSTIASRIRASLTLQDNLEAAVTEIRGMLQSDRLLIYQFQADGSGTVVAESVQAGWVSALQHRIADPCFQLGTATRYRQGTTTAIANIYQAGYPHCYLQLLESYQVKANLVVPLIVEGELWGLLVGHQCADYRTWQDIDLEFLGRIAVQLAIAIQQANAYERAQAEIAERQRREQEIHLLYQLTQAILEVEDFEAALEATVRQICQLTHWTFGEVWVPSSDQTYLHLSPSWYCQDPALESFRRGSLDLSIPIHVGLPGRVWASQQPEWIRDISEQSSSEFLRLAAAQASGLKAAFGVPILANQGVMAVLVLLTTAPCELDAPLLQLVTSAMTQLGQIIQRKRAEAALRQSESKTRALLSALPDLTMRMSGDGLYLDFLPTKTFKVFGDDDLIGQGIYDGSLPLDLAERRMGYIREALRTGELQIYEQQIWIEGQLRTEEVRIVVCAQDEVIVIVRDISDRQQAEAALRASEAQNRAILSAIPDLMFQINTDGVYLTYVVDNRAFGLLPPDLCPVGQRMAEVLPPELAQRQMEYALLALATGELQVYEQQLWIAGQWQHEEVRVVKSGENQVLFIIRDITDRKRAEEALRQSEATKRAIIHAIPDLLIRVDRQGHHLETLSGGSVQQILLPIAETETPTFRDILPENLIPLRNQALQEAFETRRVQVYEQPIELAGQPCWEEVRVSPLDENEVLLMIRDITDRKQAEATLYQLNQELEIRVAQRTAALRESEGRFRQVFEQSPVGIAISDLEGRLTRVNSSLAFIMDSTGAELLQHRIQDLLQLDEQQTRLQPLQELLEHTLTAVSFECQSTTRDGKPLWVNITSALIFNAFGRPASMVHLIEDISDRKQVEAELRHTNEQLRQSNAELEQATRLKDEFLANMSHELRTPLNAILGMAEGLQEEVFGGLSEAQVRAIATIERSGKHLLELINDILDLAKIESGALELHLAPISVNYLCESSLMFVKQQALQKQIQLSTEIPLTLPDLMVDERRLRQVLINLLNNAVKFTPAGGQVQFRVSREQQSNQEIIAFSVADTGIGIAAEDMHKLFHAFVQLDSRLARQYSGTGLGLALVRQLTELHGGQVTVTSQVGQGSCFTVQLPYRTVPPPPDALLALTPPAIPLSPSGFTVLVIEDSPTAADQMTRYLKDMGLTVQVHPQGEGAIAAALGTNPALIILDILLPGLSGWGVLAQLKTDPHTRQIPVLVVSVVDEREQGLAAGAFECLVKPITRDRLRDAIARLQTPGPSEPATLLPAVQGEPGTPRPSILLVEDNRANVVTLSSYLESRGYHVTVAKDGFEGIAFAQAHAPDLILMDIQMPEMDGLEAIQRLRAFPTTARIPIIALTALAMPGDRERCLAAGANDYYAKPVILRQLLGHIQRLLNE